MLKFTGQIANTKLVLVRRHIGDGSAGALIFLRTPNRAYASNEYCKPPDNAPKALPAPKKSSKFFWSSVGVAVLTGAAVVYAKNSKDTRNWLESNLPIANDFVALVYQENATYWETAVNQFNKTSRSLSNFMFGKEGVSPPDIVPRYEQDLDKDAEVQFAKKEYTLPPATFQPMYIEEKKYEPPELATEATLVQTEKCNIPTPPPIKITKDLVEIEHEMHENTKIAVDQYKLAKSFCTEYNKALFRIIEAPAEDVEKSAFAALDSAQKKRNSTYETARNACAKARCAIETLDRMIKAGVQAPIESITATKRHLKQFRDDLAHAEDDYKSEFAKAEISEKYWSKVEHARAMFKEQLVALFPNIDLCAKKLDLRGDTDLFLLFALKQIQYLQTEIAKFQTIRELQINRAIECLDEKAIIDAKVEDMLVKERIEKEKEFLNKSLQVQAAANLQIKNELKRQFEIQQDVLQSRLNAKEKEIMYTFSRTVSEKVEAERVLFKKDLAAMAGKLAAIEQTLKQRAAAEAEARRSQSLWAAAEALLAATRRPGPNTKVDNELKALEKAGQGDQLVQTVLKGIRPEIKDKGIVTEKALRDRFETMEKTALKVALIGREGASLPVYFLSWVQSKLLFSQFGEIPRDELNNLPTDFTKLDTFDIIQRAKYHMEHGCLGSALRYVNLLQGAARAASRGWADDARAHLEVRQAAETVMTHASVAGMLYL